MKSIEPNNFLHYPNDEQGGSASLPQFKPQPPWWQTPSGRVLIAIYILFIIVWALVMPRALMTELVNVNGLEVLRDVEPARMNIRHSDAELNAVEALEKFLGTKLDDRYTVYARPWASDARQRYFALFDNSIDSFNLLRDLYILREGWRVDFRARRQQSFDWSVWLDSRGRLLGLQYNGNVPSGASTTQDYARMLVQRVFAASVYANISSLEEVEVRQLEGGWSFGYADAADYKLLKGRPMLRFEVMSDRISHFWFGLQIPEVDAARLDKGYAQARTTRWIALGVIGVFLLWLLIFMINRILRGYLKGSRFWTLCFVCVGFMLFHVLDRYHYVNLWLAGQELPRLEGIWLIPVWIFAAIMTALLASWGQKWLDERVIKPDYMPMLGKQLPLLLFMGFVAGFAAVILHHGMGLAHMFPGPSQIFPLYSGILVNSFVLFVLYLFLQGLLILAINRYEAMASRAWTRMLFIMAVYLVAVSASFLLVVPLRLPPYDRYSLRLACLFLPALLATMAFFLYPVRVRNWNLYAMLWMLAPVIMELVAPSYKEGGLAALMIWTLIVIYAWQLQLGFRNRKLIAKLRK